MKWEGPLTSSFLYKIDTKEEFDPDPLFRAFHHTPWVWAQNRWGQLDDSSAVQGILYLVQTWKMSRRHSQFC